MDKDAIRAERTLLESILEDFHYSTEKLETEAELQRAISLAETALDSLKSFAKLIS